MKKSMALTAWFRWGQRQWQSFSKVPNLIQFVSNGNCYGRLKLRDPLALGTLAALRLAALASIRPKPQGREDYRRSIPAKEPEFLQKEFYTGAGLEPCREACFRGKLIPDGSGAFNSVVRPVLV
jgi:hypothetical protein